MNDTPTSSSSGQAPPANTDARLPGSAAMITGSARRVREALGRVIVGQDEAIDLAMVTLLAGGHALIEGVPGVGKTLLVKALASAVAGEFQRIQFTRISPERAFST
jgi:MoxR-like ATPase